MTEPDLDLDALEKEHRLHGPCRYERCSYCGTCDACGQPYPCDTVRLIERLQAAETELARQLHWKALYEAEQASGRTGTTVKNTGGLPSHRVRTIQGRDI